MQDIHEKSMHAGPQNHTDNLARENLAYARKKRHQESNQKVFSLSKLTLTTM